MSEPEQGSFIRFMQLPWEIRHMVWGEAWADRKPEVCIHLYTGSSTNGLPGFPPTQLTVDIDVALMHICRESRAFLTSKAGGVRFRYSLTAKRNVPCRAFDPALDTLYLGEHNFIDAIWENEHFYQRSWYHPHTLPALPINEFVDCWKAVQNIALEPGVMFPTGPNFPTLSDTRAGVVATFPQLQRISIVVNPFVDLESSSMGEAAVCPPARRCRLAQAAGITTWPGIQPEKHWLDTVREEIEPLGGPGQAILLAVQTFEVYVVRKGRKQWKKHPL